MRELKESNILGFYHIYGYSNYIISKDGQVFNITRKEFLTGSVNPSGYWNFRLTDDHGVTLTWGLHRLLGFVFLYPGENYKKLTINHKDGNKANNSIQNLEWMTQKENQEHAGHTGLTEKWVPVSVRNVDTGEVKFFTNIITCAMFYGMSKDAISYRVSIGEKRVFPERRQYKKGYSVDTWYIPESIEKSLLENSTSKSVQARNVFNNEEYQFRQISELAKFAKVGISTASVWLTLKNQPIVGGCFQVKKTIDKTPWRLIENLEEELKQIGSKRMVSVYDSLTQLTTTYSSLTECCVALNIKITTLSARLKTNGEKIFKDQKSFKYL